MVAYVKNANGNWDVPTLWTPNGTPGATDTVTLGAFTTTVPVGYIAQCGGITSYVGTNVSTRSVLEIAGVLEMYGDTSQGIWTTLSFIGASRLDLRGWSWAISYTNGETVRAQVISDGTGLCEIISSTTLGFFGGSAGGQGQGLLDLNKFHVENVTFLYGGSSRYLTNYKLRNGVFYNCGQIKNYDYLHNDSDWVMENVDFRGTQYVVDGLKTVISARSSGGTITGLRSLKNVTFDPALAGSVCRFMYLPSVMDIDGVYYKNCYIEALNNSATFKNIFAAVDSSSGGVVGEGGAPIDGMVVSMKGDNPHAMTNLCVDLQNFYIETLQPGGSLDAGDHFILKNGATSNIRYGIINDNWGGSGINALGISLTGTHTLEHCTFVYDLHTSDYGLFARNEGGGVYNTAANITVRSNIAHVRSAPTGITNSRVYNLVTAGDDQLDFIDNNLMNGFGSNNAILYYGVTSATKGAIGSQAGWALNDVKNVNPNFVDQNRNVQSWATQYGATDYDTAITYALDAVNGYNRTTHRQTTQAHTVVDMLQYLRAGYTPTNAAISTAAHDGTTIGALAYVPAVSVDTYPAFIRSGSTGNAYTTTGLSSVSSITIGSLAATSISDTSGDGTHSVPSLSDGVAHELYGIKTIAINGVGGSPTTTALLNPLTTQNYITLAGTLNTTNTGVLYNFSPAAVAGDQVVFLTANNTSVDAQGNLATDLVGTQQMWHIQASTGIARSYLVVTGAAADSTPDPFSFNTPALAALGATVTSTNAAISGIDAATAVSVTGGLVSINGGAFVSSGTINNGQTIAARVTASGSYFTAVTATVNIGGVTAQFTATTIADPGPPANSTVIYSGRSGGMASNLRKQKSRTSKMISKGEKGITQATPESSRTLVIDVDKLQSFAYQYGVSPQDGATGAVQIYAKTPSVNKWSLMASITLDSLTEPDYSDKSGCFDMFKFVPVGVTGEFDIFVYAW